MFTIQAMNFWVLLHQIILPYILQPSSITSHSKTLINNIFINTILPHSITGNPTAKISDHLPQFLKAPNIFSNPPSNKSNIYERDCLNLNKKILFMIIFPSTGMKQ